ncbi:manganese efflux pump MntP family protein [bacterium]|nr:manganese efflux pump MntP family protein [bacterium]MBU1675506.1 manganese efflux pump MntP family protein [bacterium]
MSMLEILPLAVALAMDAFAVSVGAGAAGRARGARATFRLAFHFGLFQFIMPVIGWLAGSTVARRVASVDHWIAFALLAWIGGGMIRAAFRADENDRPDPSRGWSLVLLSVATSIDALAVGFSLALLGVRIWQPSVVIGLVAAAFSAVGHRGGDRLGRRFGKRAEFTGGVILAGIGVKILVEHLGS